MKLHLYNNPMTKILLEWISHDTARGRIIFKSSSSQSGAPIVRRTNCRFNLVRILGTFSLHLPGEYKKVSYLLAFKAL